MFVPQQYQSIDTPQLDVSHRTCRYLAGAGAAGTGAFVACAEPDPLAAAELPAPPAFLPRPLLGGPLPPPLGP